MWFLELQIICAVHLAKPFGHYSSLRLCTVQRGALCTATSRGSHWQCRRGSDSLALPWLSGSPSGRSPPSHRAEPLASVCIGALSPMALGWSAVLHCETGILKGRLYRRVLSWSVAYMLGSQEKYLVAKCILMRPRCDVACANYSINYCSFSETCFGRRAWHWSVL